MKAYFYGGMESETERVDRNIVKEIATFPSLRSKLILINNALCFDVFEWNLGGRVLKPSDTRLDKR